MRNSDLPSIGSRPNQRPTHEPSEQPALGRKGKRASCGTVVNETMDRGRNRGRYGWRGVAVSLPVGRRNRSTSAGPGIASSRGQQTARARAGYPARFPRPIFGGRAGRAPCPGRRNASPSFSTRGVGGPGNRSRTTSWSKGLHYKSYPRLFSSNFPAHPVCMALRMADEVTTNDCSHKSRAGK